MAPVTFATRCGQTVRPWELPMPDFETKKLAAAGTASVGAAPSCGTHAASGELSKSMGLCWRGTFIDGPPESPTVPQRARALSEPAGRRLLAEAGLFVAERCYVATLAPWCHSTGDTTTAVAADSAAKSFEHTKGDGCDFGRQTSGDSELLSTRAPSTGGRDQDSEPPAGEPGDEDISVESDDEHPGCSDGLADGLSRRQSSDAGSVTSSPLGGLSAASPLAALQNPVVAEALLRAKLQTKMPAELPRSPTPEPALPAGSVGHPFLCSRPCIFLARGFCAEGDACGYCHLQHPQRESHLDKRSRELLRGLSFPQRLQAMLPLLREKVQQLQLGKEGESALDLLVRSEVSSASEALQAPVVLPRHLRSVLKVLSSQSLRAVLAELCAGLPQPCGERESVAVLLQRLRSQARGAAAQDGHC